MRPMQARCPQCQTLFNITQRHLNMANGKVRCNQCRTIFDGYAALVDESTAEEHNEKPKIEEDNFALQMDRDTGNRVDINPNQEAKPKNLIYGDLLEDDYDKPRRFQRTKQAFSTLFVLLLLSFLIVQFAYLKRTELIEIAELAPWINKACDTVPQCHIPEKRALHLFTLDSRHIYSHPNIDKALVVSATFSNNAEFSQPYPTLVLSMSDIRGREVAARRFNPTEYISDTANLDTKMDNGQPITVNLEIADPGDDAMAFELDFL